MTERDLKAPKVQCTKHAYYAVEEGEDGTRERKEGPFPWLPSPLLSLFCR